MSIHYDKLTFTKEQVKKDAEEMDDFYTIEEDDLFYSIVFPLSNNKKK